MRMPHPFNGHTNKIITERYFGKNTAVIAMFPTGELYNPGDIELLTAFADDVQKSYGDYIAQALDKIYDNHYREYLRISHGENCNPTLFRSGLELQYVSLWVDGSWAMVFKSEIGVLSNNSVCASFPVDRPAFTSLIGL